MTSNYSIKYIEYVIKCSGSTYNIVLCQTLKLSENDRQIHGPLLSEQEERAPDEDFRDNSSTDV